MAVDLEVGLRAADYLARAVQRWPEDGELRWDYGSLLRFELAPLLSAGPRKTALLERAAPELEAAARMGAGPPWLGLVNANLLTQLGRAEQAIRHLELLVETLHDPAALKEIRARLAAMYAERDAALAAAREAPSAERDVPRRPRRLRADQIAHTGRAVRETRTRAQGVF